MNDGDEQLLRCRVYGHDHDDPNPGPLPHPTYAFLAGGPLDGPLLDITGWRPQEIEDGVALMTELGRWPGGRALYDPLPGIRAVVPAFGVGTVGTGSLVFVGLDNWTGLGTFSLAIPDVPQAASPTVAEFGWALVIGLVAAFVGTGIRRLSLLLQARVERHP